MQHIETTYRYVWGHNPSTVLRRDKSFPNFGRIGFLATYQVRALAELTSYEACASFRTPLGPRGPVQCYLNAPIFAFLFLFLHTPIGFGSVPF